MCRLFGLSAGTERVAATIWLLNSPDSLVSQSHRNPDGTGLGTFDRHGDPVIHKEPIAAFEDSAFAREAREEHSTTFVAHVRYATGTPHTVANTHPFTMAGRIFAHNGVVGDLPALEEHLGPDLAAVKGDTDSERVFALITRETAAAGGDVPTGITNALSWLADNVPVYAVNIVMATATDLWAVRWPDTHDLYVLDRREVTRTSPLDHRSRHGTRIVSQDLADRPAVVVATERLDTSASWDMVAPGELVHVGPDLELTRTVIIDRPPRHRLTP